MPAATVISIGDEPIALPSIVTAAPSGDRLHVELAGRYAGRWRRRPSRCAGGGATGFGAVDDRRRGRPGRRLRPTVAARQATIAIAPTASPTPTRRTRSAAARFCCGVVALGTCWPASARDDLARRRARTTARPTRDVAHRAGRLRCRVERLRHLDRATASCPSAAPRRTPRTTANRFSGSFSSARCTAATSAGGRPGRSSPSERRVRGQQLRDEHRVGRAVERRLARRASRRGSRRSA